MRERVGAEADEGASYLLGHSYDEWAAVFAQQNAAMPEPVERLAARFLGLLPCAPDVLDVGCGHGRDMAWFEARGATVVGVDISARMLALARERTTGALHEMDMRDLRIMDGAFDGVWVNASLLHVAKRDAPQVVKDFARVLRPRGVLALTAKHGDGEAVQRRGEANSPFFFAFYTADELARLATAEGLRVLYVATAAGVRCEWIHVIATVSAPSE